MKIREIKADFIRCDYRNIFNITQYNKNIPIKINLYEDGEAYKIPSGAIVKVEASIKSDREQVAVIITNATVGDNYVLINNPREMCLCNGDGALQVRIEKDNYIYITPQVKFKVVEAVLSEGTVTSTIMTTAKEKLDEKISEAVEIADTLQQAIKTGGLDNKAEKTYVDEKVNTINSNVDKKVTKVSGKGLSTNDFTNAYKAILDGLKTTINNAVLEGKKSLYPVGSLYFNATSNANPSQLLGFGTWEQIAQGKTLVGVNPNDTDFKTAGKTGGSKTHNHGSGTLIADIGAINNDLGKLGYNATEAIKNRYNRGISASAVSEQEINTINHATTTSGNTANASSLQPYITVYIWKRTK